jgi:C4-dicarboxylate-specific signal transduction histidine kinase
MSERPSLRQPLVLYALVFLTATAMLVLTMASFSMVHSNRRAYRRAAQAQLLRLARLPESTRTAVLRDTPTEELPIWRVSSRVETGHRSISLADARRAQYRDEGELVSVRIRQAPVESYLVAELDLKIPTSMAFSEVSRLVPLVMMSALALAGLLMLVTSRLVIRPLALMADAVETPDALSVGDAPAPNEIVDVAQRFRRTVRRLQDEQAVIRAQKDELERMQESLIRASRLASVGRLAAGVAHEVGNPLAAVKGYLGLLRGGLEEPERAEVLDRSLREVTRIHETIKKLLTFARSGEDEAGSPQPVDVATVLQQAWEVASGHPAVQDVQLHAAEPDEAPRAMAHPERLGQVFVNLLVNAGQAMEGRGEVRVQFERSPRGWSTHVDDEGPGVPEHLRASVFDPFFSTKEPGEGTGLGLAVSRAMVEAMGGDLRLGTSPAGGARFTVDLEAAARPGGHPPVG